MVLKNKALRQLVVCLLGGSMVLIMLPVSAWAADDCFLNGKEVSPDNGATTEGKTGIMHCKDRESGKPTRDKELRAGKWVGLTRDYVNGLPSIEYGRDENGRDHGFNRKFAPNKQMIFEEFNEHGKQVGIKREWYLDGGLKTIEFAGKDNSEKANARYTPKKQLNDLNCSSAPRLAPHVDDASLCGFKGKPSTVEFFNDEGKLRGREIYLAGVTQKAQEFDVNSGKVTASMELQGTQRTEVYFNDGVKQREEVINLAEKQKSFVRKAEYHESGAMVQEQKFAMLELDGRRRNVMTSEAQFFLNGQPKSLDSFSVDGKDIVRESKKYHDNGKLAEQGRYFDTGAYRNRPLGVHQSFSSSGVLIGESHHDAKGNRNRERKFDEKGSLQSDEQLFEDGSRKSYAK